MRGAECWTDHRLVRTSLRSAYAFVPQPENRNLSVNLTSAAWAEGQTCPAYVQPYRLVLHRSQIVHLCRFKAARTLQKQWDTLSKAVVDAAVDTLGYSTRKHQDWFGSNDGEIQTLLNERNAAFAAKLRTPAQRSQLQKRLREMENTWWLSKATEIQNYADANMAHQFYEAIKAVYSPKSHSTHPVRTKVGITLIKDKKDILSRWAEHLQELLNQGNPVDQSIADQLPQLPII